MRVAAFVDPSDLILFHGRLGVKQKTDQNPINALGL